MIVQILVGQAVAKTQSEYAGVKIENDTDSGCCRFVSRKVCAKLTSYGLSFAVKVAVPSYCDC